MPFLPYSLTLLLSSFSSFPSYNMHMTHACLFVWTGPSVRKAFLRTLSARTHHRVFTATFDLAEKRGVVKVRLIPVNDLKSKQTVSVTCAVLRGALPDYARLLAHSSMFPLSFLSSTTFTP